MKTARIALVLAAALLLLASCLFPGKFTSTLDIKRDRSFTFTYAGEVFVLEENEARSTSEGAEESPPTPAEIAARKAKQEQERRAIAEALSKEQGYRSVRYLGDGRFLVDYAVSGRLDHNFLFPFNSDAEAIFPWIAIELRKDGTARMKAPAFGDEGGPGGPSLPGLGGGAGPAEHREGSFTLTTDAEIVMHNVEEGIAPGPARKLVWKVTPASKTVPTAVVRFAN